jgi:DNA-binding MarR family transcriptional regulator
VTIVSLANYHGRVPRTAPPTDVRPLASQLRVSLARLARRLRSESDPAVTPTQLSGLATIERHGPMTAGDLAAHEHIRKPTATRLIASLVQRGLIERVADPLDGRVVWLRLTAAGERHLQGVRRRKDRYLSDRLQRLDPTELATLSRAAAILDRLGEDAG